MIAACLTILCASAFAAGDNLLANPGFEQLTGERPARWDLFAQPQEGAFGRLSDEAHGGNYCVTLHIPMPYARDPANNWSQNIIADLGGKKLRLSGWIRVVEATEAAYWVQCWRRNPLTLLKFVTTSTDTPVYGTQDWQEVVAEVDVPKTTDFLTVRCVLKGVGSAWFDDVALAPVEEVPPVPAPVEAPAAKESPATAPATTPAAVAAPAAPKATLTAPAAPPAPPIATPAAPAAPPVPSAPPAPRAASVPGAPAAAPSVKDFAALENEVAELRATNEALANALRDMNQSNQRMLDEILLLRDSVRSLQSQGETANVDAAPAAPAVPAVPAVPQPAAPAAAPPPASVPAPLPVPPLVPHGVDWRTYR